MTVIRGRRVVVWGGGGLEGFELALLQSPARHVMRLACVQESADGWPGSIRGMQLCMLCQSIATVEPSLWSDTIQGSEQACRHAVHTCTGSKRLAAASSSSSTSSRLESSTAMPISQASARNIVGCRNRGQLSPECHIAFAAERHQHQTSGATSDIQSHGGMAGW